MFKKLEEQVSEKVPKPIVEETVRRLSAFNGREYEDYAYLIKPATEYVSRAGYRQVDMEEFSEFIREILSTKPKTISMETEPSVTAEFLAEQIKPWVEVIREKLFHSKSAPFSRIKDAEKWLDQVRRKRDAWSKAVDEWKRRANEWHEKMLDWREKKLELEECALVIDQCPDLNAKLEKFNEFQDINLTLQSLRKALEIGDPGEPPEQDKDMETAYALTHDVVEIRDATGFTYKSAEMHILTDAPPVLPPFTVGIIKETHSLPSGRNLQNRFAQVTIRGDLTFKDWRSLHRTVRQGLGIEYSRPLDERHLELYKLVGSSSAIPKGKGAGAFWKSKMEEWNVLHPGDEYTTPNGVKFAYNRIAARVEGNTKEEAQNER